MTQLDKIIEDIQNCHSGIEQSSRADVYWKLSTVLQSLDNELREHIQALTEKEMLKVIDKLKSGAQLSEQELHYVKLWIVGDADYYVKYENNYQEWVNELERLVGVIAEFKNKDVDFQNASQLRAISLDAVRVIGDILFFVTQQQRIRNFSESNKSIDAGERQLLIDLLQGKMISPTE